MDDIKIFSSVLDTLTKQIAVIDLEGTIVYTNHAWQEFARQNGATDLNASGVGSNYIEVCKNAANCGDADAQATWQGMRSVLKGETQEFMLEYPCHAPDEKRWFSLRFTPLPDARGYFLASHKDITQGKLAEMANLESEQKYRTLIESLNEGIWVIDQESITTFVNPRMAEMLGYGEGEMIGKHLFTFMDEQGVEIAKRELERRRAGIRERHDFEFLCKDGSRLYTSLEASPILDEEGNYQGAMAGVQDITQRKEHEVALRQALYDKEMLLKEVHHRVKNNLNLIYAMLDLQGERISDQAASRALRDSQNRIRTIAHLHETLYHSENLSRLNARDYFEELANSLFLAGSGEQGDIELQLDIDEIDLSLDTAIPCGLVLTELVSNALKHAFPPAWQAENSRPREVCDTPQAQIRVSFHRQGEVLALEVADNGVGLPPGLDLRHAPSLGLQLVEMFAQHLGGVFDCESNCGARFRIEFLDHDGNVHNADP
jgi:PAS domain S-box-containing protein